MSHTVIDRLKTLTTPHLADGCLRASTPIRVAPTGLRPLLPTMQCAGRARPVRHVGSIDVFFEILEDVRPGEILVIDNGGRLDEACIGDIVALEARAADVAGLVIWGLHRDNKELSDIDFPIFSLGALPTGPQRLHARPEDVFSTAAVGQHVITSRDFVVADSNGVLFVAEDRLEAVIAAAITCRETETRQLKAMKSGQSFRDQVRFSDYLTRRADDSTYGFRQHLKSLEAAGEA